MLKTFLDIHLSDQQAGGSLVTAGQRENIYDSCCQQIHDKTFSLVEGQNCGLKPNTYCAVSGRGVTSVFILLPTEVQFSKGYLKPTFYFQYNRKNIQI